MNQSKGIICRWAKHSLWIIPLAGLLLYLNLSHSFMAIGSESMLPTLQVGDLIFTHVISPDKLQVGDIVDFKVPYVFQKLYNYPPTICHRIISIEQTSKGPAFRTKGDNTSEDPFLHMPQDVVGIETRAIRYLGYPVMFVQSRQCLYLMTGLLILFFLYKKGENFTKGAQKLRGSVFGASTVDLNNFQKEQQQQMQNMTDHVTQSMDMFSAAMTEYAKHLESHTAAVQSLAQAARHLEMNISEIEANSQRKRPVPGQESDKMDSESKSRALVLSK